VPFLIPLHCLEKRQRRGHARTIAPRKRVDAARVKHVARKRFGQHFLHDPGVIAKLVDAIDPRPADRMVEIGPGLGALTFPLLERVSHLHVVELDRDLAQKLRESVHHAKMTVHQQDALAFDFAALGPRLRVIGNLPYNISTPLLFHIARLREQIVDCHFMLQREVVDRMVARPSTAAYGRLSVALQLRFDMERLFRVGPGAFQPPPKVESAIVRMRPLTRPLEEPEVFDRVLTAAFAQRRKTLRNALRGHFCEEDFAALRIDPRLRAENLAPEDFARMACYKAQVHRKS
jgi:16S rRNA (adenine1518-N6/adenine1519-N6)-dimethyltransferase